MQPAAPAPDPRDRWQHLGKTPGKLGNTDLFAKTCLWKHRYLEVAVPPAKGSCCSTIKEPLKLLIWQFLPWEAELARHSCRPSPLQQCWRSCRSVGRGQTDPPRAQLPSLGQPHLQQQPQTRSSEPSLTPSSPDRARWYFSRWRSETTAGLSRSVWKKTMAEQPALPQPGCSWSLKPPRDTLPSRYTALTLKPWDKQGVI